MLCALPKTWICTLAVEIRVPGPSRGFIPRNVNSSLVIAYSVLTSKIWVSLLGSFLTCSVSLKVGVFRNHLSSSSLPTYRLPWAPSCFCNFCRKYMRIWQLATHHSLEVSNMEILSILFLLFELESI